jgi:hypothetical protein
MRVLTSRPKRVIAATALFSAITFTGVGAAQATASPPHQGSGGKDIGQVFSGCMREHGLKNFPDVHIQIDKGKSGTSMKSDAHAAKGKGGGAAFDPTSKAYQRALNACGPILKRAGVPMPVPVPPDKAHCTVIKGGKGDEGLPQPPKLKIPSRVHFSTGGSEKGTTRHKEVCLIRER